MGWAAVRRPRGILLPQGAGPAGCTPHFLFPLVEKKTGRARSKRKDRLDALRRVRASARRGAADRCKRRFWPAFGHAFPFCKFVTAVPWRMVRRSSGWSSHGAASLFAAASCPARELPIKASAPTTARAARSEAERAEREAGQMRSCTPTPSAPSATGRQSGKSQKSIACPKARPNRSRHWYADPRTRGGPLHRSAPGAFFSYTGRGAFSFWRNQKENGGRIAQLAPQLNPPGG